MRTSRFTGERVPNRTRCQKRTGSAYSVASHFDRKQVRTGGACKQFRRSSDSGRSMDFAFCP